MYVNMDHVYITFPSYLQGHPRPISPGALIGICDCPSDIEDISMFYALCSYVSVYAFHLIIVLLCTSHSWKAFSSSAFHVKNLPVNSLGASSTNFAIT